MKYRWYVLALPALMAPLLCAQETKLANCRTLEAAGNFIGSDEVLNDGMVCQVVEIKGTPTAESGKKSRDALMGIIEHDSTPAGTKEEGKPEVKAVVESKPEEKATVAGRKDAAERSAPTSGIPAAVVERPTEMRAEKPVAVEREEIPPVVPEVATPTPPTSPATSSVDSPAIVAQPAAPTREEAPKTVESTAEPNPAPAAATVEEAPKKFETGPEPSAAPAVETRAEVAPSGFDSAVATAPAAAPEAEAEPKAEEATMVSARDDGTSHERERVVQTGTFDQPRVEPSDPNFQPHRNSFHATEEDGFQEGQRAECTKNVTLGSLKEEKLVLGITSWATRWIEKNQRRVPLMCFSDTPMQGARNYLIVFYTSPAALKNGEMSKTGMISPAASPMSGVGTFTTSYGSTWHYAYERTVGVTVNSRDDADVPHSQPGQVLYATAYREDGVPVAQHWPGMIKKQGKEKSASGDPRKKKDPIDAAMEHELDVLLNEMVEDLNKL